MPETSTRRISLVIDTHGNVGGIDQVLAKYAQLETQTDRLFNALKTGVAIDIGGRLVSGLAAVPGLFERAIERGVQFNAVLETSRLGIAAVLKQFDREGRFKSFDDALAASAGAIDLLKQKAKESPATFQSLVQAYQALAGPLSAANVPMAKQVDLIVNMSQALSGLGISSQQLLQETRALVTGNINADAAAAKILGITAADVNGAKQRGQLYEFLSGKIAAFAEAGKRGASTYQTAMSNLDDAIDDVLAKISKPVFEALTKGTLDLSAALNDPEIVNSLRDIGEMVAGLVAAGYDLTRWAIENRDALILVAKAAAAVGAAYTAINLASLVAGLALKTAAFVKSTMALEAETAALGRNTAAQAANAAARAVGGSPGLTVYGRDGSSLESARRIAVDAEQRRLVRAANLGEWNGSVLPAGARLAGGTAASAAPGFLSMSGFGATGAAALAGPFIALVVAGLGAWLVKAQLEASAAARERATNEQGDRYSSDIAGNAKAMSAMVTGADKLAVLERIRTQEARAQEDIYAAIADGDDVRVRAAEQQLKFLQLQRGQVDGVFDRVHALNGVEADRLRILKETQEFVKKSEADRDARAKNLPETQRRYDDIVMRTADDQEKLGILARRRSELPSDAAIATMSDSIDRMSAGKERDAAEQRLLEISGEVLDIAQQRAAVEKSIADKIADQAKKLADQQQARADYILEIQIAEARASGMDAVAGRLENEKKLRDEIRRIVEATGASEEEAERAARRKLSAEWQLEQKKAGAAGSQVSGFKPQVSQPETISIYDNRAVGRLREADANGRIPLVPTAPAVASVVPSASRVGTLAGRGNPGDLAGAVANAADAIKKDATSENLEALRKEIDKLAAVAESKNRDEAAKWKALSDSVQNLVKQFAASRAR